MVRFLDVVHGLDTSFVDEGTLDSLPLPSGEGSSKIGGIDLNKARMRAVFEAVVALSPSPDGFTAAALATATAEAWEVEGGRLDRAGVVAGGAGAGGRLGRRIEQERFRRIVLIVLFVLGLNLLRRAIF